MVNHLSTVCQGNRQAEAHRKDLIPKGQPRAMAAPPYSYQGVASVESLPFVKALPDACLAKNSSLFLYFDTNETPLCGWETRCILTPLLQCSEVAPSIRRVTCAVVTCAVPTEDEAHLLGLLLERLLSNVFASSSYLLELVLLFHGRSWHISLQFSMVYTCCYKDEMCEAWQLATC